MEDTSNLDSSRLTVRPRAALISSVEANPPSDVTMKTADEPINLEAQPFSNQQQWQSSQPLVSNSAPKHHRASKFQIALAGLAGIVLVVGLIVSWQTVRTNRAATSAVKLLTNPSQGLSAAATNSTTSSNVPSSTKPSQRAIDGYVVAADLARYIKIPKLGVYARVMQVGVGDDGYVASPKNIYDAAWYTGSAKPGQSGATLIDGHVSSWDSHGVFYDLKTLAPGDAIQIVRGDGSTLDYVVVTSRVYADDNVDMAAALTPITTGKSGLSLVTCAGKVKPGTSDFSQRLIVFAQLK